VPGCRADRTYDFVTTPDDARGPPSTSRTDSSSRWRTFPMGENHDVFRRYLLQALERIRTRSAAAHA
jgi:hypothetical protein